MPPNAPPQLASKRSVLMDSSVCLIGCLHWYCCIFVDVYVRMHFDRLGVNVRDASITPTQ